MQINELSDENSSLQDQLNKCKFQQEKFPSSTCGGSSSGGFRKGFLLEKNKNGKNKLLYEDYEAECNNDSDDSSNESESNIDDNTSEDSSIEDFWSETSDDDLSEYEKCILGIGSKVDIRNDYDGEDSDDSDNDWYENSKYENEIETDEEYEL